MPDDHRPEDAAAVHAPGEDRPAPTPLVSGRLETRPAASQDRSRRRDRGRRPVKATRAHPRRRAASRDARTMGREEPFRRAPVARLPRYGS